MVVEVAEVRQPADVHRLNRDADAAADRRPGRGRHRPSPGGVDASYGVSNIDAAAGLDRDHPIGTDLLLAPGSSRCGVRRRWRRRRTPPFRPLRRAVPRTDARSPVGRPAGWPGTCPGGGTRGSARRRCPRRRAAAADRATRPRAPAAPVRAAARCRAALDELCRCSAITVDRRRATTTSTTAIVRPRLTCSSARRHWSSTERVSSRRVASAAATRPPTTARAAAPNAPALAAPARPA